MGFLPTEGEFDRAPSGADDQFSPFLVFQGADLKRILERILIQADRVVRIRQPVDIPLEPLQVFVIDGRMFVDAGLDLGKSVLLEQGRHGLFVIA